MKKFKTTCSYCGVGCGIEVSKTASEKITIEGDKDHPVNMGMLCSKGMNLHHVFNDRTDRLLYPQMRYNRSAPLQKVTWDEALDRSAAVFSSIIKKHGPESVAFYVSGQCLTEEYYLWNKLMKGFIRSNNIDTNSRLCMSSAVVAYKKTLGEDCVPVCYDDIELSDCILIEGGNPAWCHPILWRRIEQHKKDNPDVKIITIDPRKTQTGIESDLHVDILPGTDIYFNNAVGRVLIERNKIDIDFILDKTEGFEKYKEEVFKVTVKEAAEICKISEELILTAAQWIGDAKGFLSMWTMGLNQSVIGVNKNISLINLSLITGKIGKPGNGPFSLTGQPNAMGGREVGGLSNMLASHRELSNPSDIQEMEHFWGVQGISNKAGLTATEMFESLAEGKLKAIWVVCTNPAVSMPNSNLIEKAFANAKYVIVQDISSRSDTVKFADVVLPAAGWGEKDGTMTNAERRIGYLEKFAEPPGDALPDTEIIIRFAHKMGWGESFKYESAAQIYKEYAASTKGTNIDVSSLSFETLAKGTIQWPVESSLKSKKRLFENHNFYTTSRKAQIIATAPQNESEPLSDNFPLILLTGRVRDQWHTKTKTGKVNKLNQHLSEPFVEVNPFDALVRGIENDQVVELESSRGSVRLKAIVTDNAKPGTCFLPMHWGKVLNNTLSRANNLTSSLVDPLSKEPDFKYAAVQLKKYRKKKEKIIVIGAGSAGLGFISSYRKLNMEDEIEVFSKEIYPFYNRVMLPDYVSGTQSWKQLVKLREDQFVENGIKVHKGLEVVKIDRENKAIVDSNGSSHFYDKLFLGMGSSAFMPRNFPKIKGIFNMRSRLDADALGPFIEKKCPVVIVGGGLLGIEMAASLRELNLKVSIVQRIGRFMDRQLDVIGSEILHSEVVNKGIEVFYNDEVESFFGVECIEKVRLKSGRKLNCGLLIVAAGTVPSISIAKNANLDTSRGIVVNDFMQTSDPDIFACGEIAQWKSEMWGITAAAEEQASVVARYLAGETAHGYRGSLSMNILKMEGVSICSMGIVEVPKGDDGYEEVVFLDKSQRYYKKCVIKNDRMVGAILIGDKTEFLEFKNLISKGIELSDKRLQILRSGAIAKPLKGKLVCSCNNIGDGNIKDEIKQGCSSFEKVCELTGAGTGCGSCRPEVRVIFEESLREKEIIILK